MRGVELTFRFLFIIAFAIFALELFRNPIGVGSVLNSFWSGIGKGYSAETAAAGGPYGWQPSPGAKK